jgi:hypothetical protein
LPTLSAILPGLRELRPPLAVGGIWLASIAFLLYPHSSTLPVVSGIITTKQILGSLPQSAQAAVILFCVYVLGILTIGATNSVFNASLVRRLRLRLEDSNIRPLAWFGDSLRRPNKDALALIEGTIQERLRPISDALADMLPREMVVNEFHLASLRLSSDAAEQFQYYDRLRSEGDLRVAIAMPLLVLGLVVCSTLPMWVALAGGLAVAVATVIMLEEGLHAQHRADQILATAIYTGYASTPTLDNIQTLAKQELPADRADPSTRDVAWLCDFLVDRQLRRHYAHIVDDLLSLHAGGLTDIERITTLMKPATQSTVRQLLMERGYSRSDDPNML